jgi:hypothetical protein
MSWFAPIDREAYEDYIASVGASRRQAQGASPDRAPGWIGRKGAQEAAARNRAAQEQRDREEWDCIVRGRVAALIEREALAQGVPPDLAADAGRRLLSAQAVRELAAAERRRQLAALAKRVYAKWSGR